MGKPNALCATDAANRRKAKETKANAAPILMDTDHPDFLPTMTREALRDDAPSYMLIALCQYVAADLKKG